MRKILIGLMVFIIVSAVYAADGARLFDHFPQSDLNERPVTYDKALYLVDVWATWCPPCQMTIPELIDIQQKYASANFTVLGLSVDSSGPGVVRKFSKEYKINYPVALAGDALDYLPPVRGIPTMFLIDRDGKIVAQFIGYVDAATLSAKIDQFLKLKK